MTRPTGTTADPLRDPDPAPAPHGSDDHGVFALPHRLAAKAQPALIAGDQAHFAAVVRSLEHSIADLTERLDAERRAPGRSGQQALERDAEIHRLTTRLRTLRRYGPDLCLGRMVHDQPTPDGDTVVHVGRLGLTDGDGRRLLVDWRSPSAEPFFAATHADPKGLVSRRRYRWSRERIVDYWDEVFSADAEPTAALDDQSAFIAGLGVARTDRMRDVLSTIAADQDAIIRAGSAGTLVVDGGPGTGKTVVALHRAAYLLYADPRLGHRRGGVLFVGPHRPYLHYVSDVLPGLGEEGVQLCTLRDLVPQGGDVRPEPDSRVAQLKSSARLVAAVETAVRMYEEPPAEFLVETEWADVRLRTQDWAEAFAAPEPGTPHNEARERIWDELVSIVADRHDDDVPREALMAGLHRHRALRAALHRAWPLLQPTDVVGDLWTVPAYLHLCAPWLTPDERAALRRADPHDWTVADLPLLDAARRRLGDADAATRRLRRDAETATEREHRAAVVEDLIAADDSELMLMSMLRGKDAWNSMMGDPDAPTTSPDRLAGPFAHIVVDEAQELTDAEWQMLLARCPSRSMTVVGDRAQARTPFPESWPKRLQRVGLGTVVRAGLGINYRTPSEVMAHAEPVIRAVLPDANVPTSVRSGPPVRFGTPADLPAVLDDWLRTHADGVACVIGADPTRRAEGTDDARVRHLTAVAAKGLEFDLVVLVDDASRDGAHAGPERGGEQSGDVGYVRAVDRYVAMTRATGELVLLSPG